MDWTTQPHDDDSAEGVDSVTSATDAPDFPRRRSTKGSAPRIALLFVAGLVVVAAIGTTGFVIGHYAANRSVQAFGGSDDGNFPNFQRILPQGPSGSFALPGAGSGATPTTLPANAPSSADAAKIAAKVNPGIVDISTVSSYQSSSAAGTGMILSSNGLVLTNNHVIAGATSISVRVVSTNATYQAKVLGYSVSQDVAVLQLSGASGLTPVTTANSDQVTANQPVVGIGNAGGVGGTPSVAPGAVVATNQSLTASDPGNLTGVEKLTGMIQVAANIVPGDSGGPLVNTAGQVIGMDTAGSSSGAGYGFGYDGASGTTQGYAIPINTALAIVRTVQSGTTTASVHVGATPILGVEITATLSQFGTTPVAGVTIAGLAPGTPAASSPLSPGDVITALDGHAVTTPSQLSAYVQTLAPGDRVTVTYTNLSGVSATTTIVLTAGPAL